MKRRTLGIALLVLGLSGWAAVPVRASPQILPTRFRPGPGRRHTGDAPLHDRRLT
jgi:hypothetical protein